MGTERRSSVVGPDCRVHGYDNLYVGSSSVFPTGGFSNPTLTVIALCLRIADAIKVRLPEKGKSGVVINRERACLN
jgi:choline dehydrogenase-like flavoprotein